MVGNYKVRRIRSFDPCVFKSKHFLVLSLELIDYKWCIFIPKRFLGFQILNTLQ